MVAMGANPKIYRACARAWAALPPHDVKPGDRVAEPAVRVALDGALRLLSGPVLDAEWIAAALLGLDKDRDGLVGYDDFVRIVVQCCNGASANPPAGGRPISQREVEKASPAVTSVATVALCDQKPALATPKSGGLPLFAAGTTADAAMGCQTRGQMQRPMPQMQPWPTRAESPHLPQVSHAAPACNHAQGLQLPNTSLSFHQDAAPVQQSEQQQEHQTVQQQPVQQFPQTVAQAQPHLGSRQPVPEIPSQQTALQAQGQTILPQEQLFVMPEEPVAVQQPLQLNEGEEDEDVEPSSAYVAQIEKLCESAIQFVDPEKKGCLNPSQAKTALSLVFLRMDAPNPSDDWHEKAFQNFDEDGDGFIDLEDLCDLAVQHCERYAPTEAFEVGQRQEQPVHVAEQDEATIEVAHTSELPALATGSCPGVAEMPRLPGTVPGSIRDAAPLQAPSVQNGSESRNWADSPVSPGAAITRPCSTEEALGKPPSRPESPKPMSEAGRSRGKTCSFAHQLVEEVEFPVSSSIEKPSTDSGKDHQFALEAERPGIKVVRASAAYTSQASSAKSELWDIYSPTSSRRQPRLERIGSAASPQAFRRDSLLLGTRTIACSGSVSVTTYASNCSEWFDIRHVSTANSNNAGGGVSVSSTLMPPSARRKSKRQTPVPIASQVMTPAYSGQLKVFDEYVFGEQKGGGAFGSVMRVQHRLLGVDRACKSMSIKSRKQLALVETEVALMRKLDHPSVLRLYESYYDGDRNVFLIIELCEGGPLTARIERQRPGVLPEAEAVWAMHDLFAGLQYCHRRGIVHRDIKPDNLLYIRDVPDSPLKIIDFGLSDFRQRLTTQGERSDGTSNRVGTPHYMAPEIYMTGTYDEKVDTFASGVVLVEVLTGVHPFFQLHRDTLQSIRAKILRNEVDYNNEQMWRFAPLSAKSLAQKLLDPERERRLTASSAIRHKWISKGRAGFKNGDRVSPRTLLSLQRFGQLNVLKQAALRVLSRQLDERQLSGALRQFRLFDVDGNGSVSAEELVAGARSSGTHLDPMDVQDLVRLFGRDYTPCSLAASWNHQNGQALPEVRYSDFLAALLDAHVVPSRRQLRYIFGRFCDESGMITPVSLQNTLTAFAGDATVSGQTAPLDGIPGTTIGEEVTDDEISRVFRELGGGWSLDFEAFCSMWPQGE